MTEEPEQKAVLDPSDVLAAARLIGLDITGEEIDLMLTGLVQDRDAFLAMQKVELGNDVPTALSFSPLLPGISPHVDERFESKPDDLELPEPPAIASDDELVFASIRSVAAMLRSGKVSSKELAQASIRRLEKLDEALLAVVHLTQERALASAETLDEEAAKGNFRGLLHGIPWGAKDLLAVNGYPTTWGTEPFQNQTLSYDAAVVSKMDAAGANVVAKLSLGELAWGDVWYGGMTRSPFDTEKGSSGSSAGSAAATAAGGVTFSIGSETLGSIVSPSTACGCSSLRPTFGRVSRYGAMSLCPSMDKLGPLCRSFDDAALVFDAMNGRELPVSAGADHTLIEHPFSIPPRIDLKGWRIGVIESAFEAAEQDAHVLEELKALGATLVPITLPDLPINEMVIILFCEAATQFDLVTRSGDDDRMKRQTEDAWPNTFRLARFVPAVEYLRANRLRSKLMYEMDALMKDIDVYVHPSLQSPSLVLTNLTGHPAAVGPCGFEEDGMPRSITFTGKLFGETSLLAVARAWQESTSTHLVRPSVLAALSDRGN